MKSRVSHLLLPCLMSTLFFVIAATPAETLGCRTRGLLALMVALVSGLAAGRATFMVARSRRHQDTGALWWVASALLWMIPVGALIYLA